MWYPIVALVLGSTSPGQLALENSALRMVVDKTGGPAIVSLVHKASGRELGPPRPRNISLPSCWPMPKAAAS
jgi:hypothetical protein